MSTKYLKLKENYFLIKQEIEKKETVLKKPNINHIIVIDCSGSMYHELESIRKQLKNKLPNLVNINDTVSIIYFSGKNQYGILKESVEIKSPQQLTDLNKAIDKWLVPMGLTGFKQPLEEVKSLIERIKSSKNDGSLFSMLFLTDGYDNQWSEKEILNVISDLDRDLSNATFVEYGNYCNHNLLVKMAEGCGGKLIYSDNFDEYDIIFEKEISLESIYPKTYVKLLHVSNSDIYFSFDSATKNVLTFTPNQNNEIAINDNLEYICYISNTKPENSSLIEIGDTRDDINYSFLYLLSMKMKSKEIYYLLENELNDSYLYNIYKNCIGKQKYNSFQNDILSCLSDKSLRYRTGRNLDLSESKVSVLDLISFLSEYRIITHKDYFKYNKIGRAKKSASLVLNQDDKNQILSLLEENSNISSIESLLETIKSSKPKDLSFEYKDSLYENNFPFLKDIVYNTDRANLSFRVKYEGHVNIKETLQNTDEFIKLSENNVPFDFPTFIYRTFTIIKDGILNISKLPIFVPSDIESANRLFDYLNDNKIKYELEVFNDDFLNESCVVLIDLNSLPIIKRSDIADIKAVNTFTNFAKLQVLKAKQKVYKYFENEHFPKASKGFIEFYGEECTTILKNLGLTESNGFAPKTVNGEVSDVYIATEIKLSAKGLSSFPKVTDVITKFQSGKKMTISESLMYPPIKEYQDLVNSEYYLNSPDKDKTNILSKFFKERTKETINETRYVNSLIAKDVFSLVLSQTWFEEFQENIDNSKMSITLDNNVFEISAAMKEVEVAI